MHRVVVHPEVFSEVEAAKIWYQGKSPNLGNEFLDEIDFAITAIAESPDMWPPYSWVPGTRRFLVHRFPFAVFYRLVGETVEIPVVGHLHRKPGYWSLRA